MNNIIHIKPNLQTKFRKGLRFYNSYKKLYYLSLSLNVILIIKFLLG